MQLNVKITRLHATYMHFRSVWLMIIGSTWLAVNEPALSLELFLCLFALLSGGLSTAPEPLQPSEATWSEDRWLSLNISAIVTLWVLLIMSNG